ncbi:unnamed protein product [Meganyctiphanes norvegica]|uniref:3'-5' exonuclease domain-containing protein n=1 Tax=Meganyctiphanes norvegica TaxID=48144 RepID=A0AAV2RDT6_MEGNR
MEENQYNTYFDELHKLWNSSRNEFEKVMLDRLASCNNPYIFVLHCMKKFPRLKKPKPDQEASSFLRTLQLYMKQNDNQNSQEYVDENTLNAFLEIIPNIQNNEIQTLFIDAFGLKEMDSKKRLRFEPIIREMIASQQYKEACNLISTLKLHEHFEGDALVIPLFLKYNDMVVVENFINGSPKYQKEFITVLDSLFGQKGYYYLLVQEYNIENNNVLKTKPKAFSNLATKLLKKYKLNISCCPHILNKRMSGSLHFIYTKFYEERSIQRSTFYSLVHDAVKDNIEMQILMIQFFCMFRDINAALPYVNKYQVPIEKLSKNVKKEYEKYSPEEIENLNFLADNGIEEVIETWDDSFPEYYPLQISENDVSLVDTVEEYVICMDKASKASLVGIDAEWKPSFGLGGDEEMGLLQLAFDNQAFLIDFIILLPILEESHWIMLINFFKNGNIRKLGFGLDNDIKVIKAMNPTTVQNLVNVKNTIDLMEFKNYLTAQCPNIFTFDNKNNKGLSGMVCQCFGRPLNKLEQFSNWSARPLSVGQIKYAAQDAQCLLDIYNYLEERCKSNGLPDWKIKKTIEVNQNQKAAAHPMASRLGKVPNKSRISSTPQAVTGRGARMNVPSVTNRKKTMVSASKFRAACDSGVQSLAQHLRMCGIDTVAIPEGSDPDEPIGLYQSEMRVIFTRGNGYERLQRCIPKMFLYKLNNEPFQSQLLQIIQKLNIVVTEDDILKRCYLCNGETFICVSSSIIKCMKENLTYPPLVPAKTDNWIAFENGSINKRNGKMDSGVTVNVKDVCDELINKTHNVTEFFVCKKCGKCYSQYTDGILSGKFSSIIQETIKN